MGLEDAPSLFRPNLISPDLLTNTAAKKPEDTTPPKDSEIVITLVHFTGSGVVHQEHKVSPEEPKPQS